MKRIFNIFKKQPESEKVIEIREAIRNGTYDFGAAIQGAADRLCDYPQALLWR